MKRVLITLVSMLALFNPLSADTLDGMEQLTGWAASGDSGATATLSQGSGSAGNALKLDYSFGSGSWVLLGKEFSYKDFSGGDQIKFLYKGSGIAGSLQVQLKAADGSVFSKTIPSVTNQPNWTEIALSFSGTSPDFVYSYGGDSVLDKTKIAQISFGVSSSLAGEGTLDIDNVRLFLSNPASKMLADFNDLSSTNKFGGSSNPLVLWPSSGACTAAYVSTVTYSGGGALELRYDVSGTNAWSGYYTELKNTDLSNTSYLSFFVKGVTGGERFKVELSVNTIFVRVHSYVTVSSAWQEVKIPLSDFSGFISSSASGNLAIIFENNVAGATNGPTQSTVYMDEIKFYQPGAANSVVETIDTMDGEVSSNGKWQKYGQYSKVLASVAGSSGLESDKAVELNFKLLETSPVADRWAVMSLDSHPNLVSGSVFRFKYKGTGGRDDIEFKVSDSNDVVFRKVLYHAAETSNEWTTAEIPYSELAYFSGAGKSLDMTKIKNIWFAVAKDKGASGTVYFDALEFVSPEAQSIKGGSFIEKLDVPYNPISPNDDGLKDKARFVYKLKDSAVVKFEIFKLSGESLYYYEKEVINDGNERVIEWDAKDKDGRRVHNGIYIYSFSAEGYDGQKDKINS